MNASVGPIMIDKSFFFSGIHFEQALFVPNQSQYNKLGSLASPPSEREEIDLSWQLSLQRVWESLRLITMMVVLNFIVKLCLAVSICFLTETT